MPFVVGTPQTAIWMVNTITYCRIRGLQNLRQSDIWKWGQHNIVLGRSSLNNIDRSQFLKVLEIHQTTVVFFVITVYRSRCLFIIIIIILKIISNVYFFVRTPGRGSFMIPWSLPGGSNLWSRAAGGACKCWVHHGRRGDCPAAEALSWGISPLATFEYQRITYNTRSSTTKRTWVIWWLWIHIIGYNWDIRVYMTLTKKSRCLYN